jgi:hypothetical protein
MKKTKFLTGISVILILMLLLSTAVAAAPHKEHIISTIFSLSEAEAAEGETGDEAAEGEASDEVAEDETGDETVESEASDEAAPYKEHIIGTGETQINAVDFDSENYNEVGADGASYDARPDEKVQTQINDTQFGGNIGWTSAEEWVQYTVTVEVTGKYFLEASAGSGSGTPGIIEFYCDGALIGKVQTNNIGWENYELLPVGIVAMTEGEHIIKTAFPDGNVNISGMIFSSVLGYSTAKEAAEGKVRAVNPQYIAGGEGFNETEGSASMFDGNVATKYCTNQMPFWAEWKYNQAYTVNRLIIATAGDSMQFPRRMCDGWTFSCSNDGENWTVIYTGKVNDVRNLNDTFFAIDLPENETAYKYYRIYAENYAEGQEQNIIQISEIALTYIPDLSKVNIPEIIINSLNSIISFILS